VGGMCVRACARAWCKGKYGLRYVCTRTSVSTSLLEVRYGKLIPIQVSNHDREVRICTLNNLSGSLLMYVAKVCVAFVKVRVRETNIYARLTFFASHCKRRV
jgi:hypothetical protein